MEKNCVNNFLYIYLYVYNCGIMHTCIQIVYLDVDMRAGEGVKVKRQVWTATATEAFSEGLCQVSLPSDFSVCLLHVCTCT